MNETSEVITADGVAQRIADAVAGDYKTPAMTTCPDCGGGLNDTDKDTAGYWCPGCHMYYQPPAALLDPDIAAAINQGWRNGLLELAVWCDQMAAAAGEPDSTTLQVVASHAKERATA